MTRLFAQFWRSFTLWTFVFVAWSIALATPAAAQSDPRWGVLAELAERDLGFADDEVASFRWHVPNKVIVITTTNHDWSGTFTQRTYYFLDELSEALPDRKAYRVKVRSLPNGDVVLAENNARTLWKETNEEYIWRPCATGGCGIKLRTHLGKSQKILSKLIAQGN